MVLCLIYLIALFSIKIPPNKAKVIARIYILVTLVKVVILF
ncbi:hypothetical protein A1OE_1110 [Candidatus Endolissoclinum faulkneri L2]|uniref:Uncharacterized protein n=1 Tax=Candidatus Endolissoclinum faulkneri L2 TaxID=1193729 RepID=K7Z5G0_9PROT|nr:hypothetical protein A1OE_1110 [Candidatus Endolissoclinum faulkneri L2]